MHMYYNTLHITTQKHIKSDIARQAIGCCSTHANQKMTHTESPIGLNKKSIPATRRIFLAVSIMYIEKFTAEDFGNKSSLRIPVCIRTHESKL